MEVRKAGRDVIQRKLLTALSDDNIVAVLLSRDDLEDIIAAARSWPFRDSRAARLSKMCTGLQRLMDEAFGHQAVEEGSDAGQSDGGV